MATAATMSGKQFDDLPYDEGRRWELQDGELIPVSGATPRHQAIVSRLVHLLQDYLEANAAGGLAIPDVEFALSDVLRLRPDVCVLLPEKAGRLDPDLIPVPGAPDIAIEVISPSERAAESHEKLRSYLRNGTAEVWQIYPKSRTMLICRGESVTWYHKINPAPPAARTMLICRGESVTALDVDQPVASPLLPGFAPHAGSFFAWPDLSVTKRTRAISALRFAVAVRAPAQPWRKGSGFVL